MKTHLLVVLLTTTREQSDALVAFDFAGAFDVTVMRDQSERAGDAACRCVAISTDGPSSLLEAAIRETARRAYWACTIAPTRPDLVHAPSRPATRADDGGRNVRRAG